MLSTLLLLQAAALPDPGFDLARLRRGASPCAAGAGDEVVVCGRTVDRRLHALPDAPPSLLPKAETGLFGKVRGTIEADARTIGPGVRSNRVMVRLKAPF